MLNLSMLLEDAARKCGDREGVIAGARRLTWREIDRAARRVAEGLRDLGIEPGDRVALSCPNVPEFPVVYFGILKAGAVVVPLNILLTPDEVAYHLRDSGATAHVCHDGPAALDLGRAGWEGFRRVRSCRHFVRLPPHGADAPAHGGGITLDELTRGRADTFETVARKAGDTAVVIYTSGTTGRPKGAELTHGNLVGNALASRDLTLDLLDPSEVQTTLVVLPLFHVYGQTSQMNGGLVRKSRLVLLPRFDPESVLVSMREERVTLFSGVPTMYRRLLDHAREHPDLVTDVKRHLTMCGSGGAAMSEALLREFESTFEVPILEGYGLSETSSTATFNVTSHPRKIGSVGLPILGCEVRVVDPEGREVPRGETGEVVVRGQNVMKGYLNRPEATREALRDGWLHTGDVGRMDEEGYLYIVDRLKDMIIRNGYNVYPREVEEVLNGHPSISYAAVVGVPDDRAGEEVMAFVVRHPGAEIEADALVAWCRERLAAYKYPRMVEFRDSLPTNASGKILRRRLREEARRESAVAASRSAVDGEPT